MIYACKITDISQTTCILRSVHAHFLQLLRDGALRGRTCRRLTLNIFFFLHSSSSALLFPVERRDGLKHRRRSVLTASSTFSSRFGAQETFQYCFYPRLSCIYLCVCPPWRHFSCVIRSGSILFSSFFSFLERVYVLWRTSRSSAADQTTSLTTQSAPRAHRPTVRGNIFMMMYHDRISISAKEK